MTRDVIATMTVSSTPGNKDSIEEIQTYIVNECPNDLKYCHMENPAAGAAKFPPGHIILIKKFINYVKVQPTACPRKRKPESVHVLVFQNVPECQHLVHLWKICMNMCAII